MEMSETKKIIHAEKKMGLGGGESRKKGGGYGRKHVCYEKHSATGDQLVTREKVLNWA